MVAARPIPPPRRPETSRPWGWPDDDVVIDAPADYNQRNQDQDDAGHLNARDRGRDQPYCRHDGDHTEDLLTSPSHRLGLPKNDEATREASRGPLPRHPYQHRPKRPVLLAVDQEELDRRLAVRRRASRGGRRQAGSGSVRPSRRVVLRPRENVEQFGAGSLRSNLTCVAFSQRFRVNLADDAAVASLAARGRITVVR